MSLIKSEGDLTLKCEECGNKIIQDSDLLSFEVEDSESANMGPRLWHGAHLEFNCENCKNLIEINFSLVEYPEGTEELKDNDIYGAELIDGLDYWVTIEEPPANKENK